jgi:acyl carrier protein
MTATAPRAGTTGDGEPGWEATMTAESPDYQELVGWLSAKVAGQLNVAPDTVDIDTPLADYGIDSAASLTLCADLEFEKGIPVETTIVWDYATIDAIAAYLVTERVLP